VNETAHVRTQVGAPPSQGEHIPDAVQFPVGRIDFRAATLADAVPLLAVLDRTFEHWPGFPTGSSREAHVEWYIDSWAPGEALTWIAEHEGRMAGFNVGYRRPAWVRGALRKGGNGAFAGIDPDYRRMYLYNWFAAWRRQGDGRDVATSFTQVEALKRSQVHLGDYHNVANSLSVFLKVLRPLDAARHDGESRLKRAPGYLALLVEGRLQHRPAPVGRCTIRPVERFDERVDALDEACGAAFDFMCGRTGDFLNWRFLDGRTGPSTALIAENGDALLGYVVLRTLGARMHIADILVVPGREEVGRTLVDAAVRRAREDGVAGIECTLPQHHPYRRALRDAGFVRLRERSRVMGYKFAIANWGRIPGLLDFLADPRARIHVTIGDSDMV